ncbi:CST complex subunit TEN1-like [Diadema antillarum]|uniref:CST complex subunit TEN1-like n=1 Tax=Diadema antillarum TaxID=105358 RepID=UPI003A8A65C3
MSSRLPPHGEIFRLSEIHSLGPIGMKGKSVRVMGKLTTYNPVKQLAIITSSEQNQTHQLTISTRLIEPFQARAGSLSQFIGEMPPEIPTPADMVVQARVVRCMDGIDTTMYYNAVEIQRRYLASREAAEPLGT